MRPPFTGRFVEPERVSTREEVSRVTLVAVRDGEPIEKALRRFKKKVEAAGILKDLRRREYYSKPSVRKKEKSAAADKRRRRALTKSRQERS
jgi:small subunit ribosomal protein S21